jgi:hypothetical protein
MALLSWSLVLIAVILMSGAYRKFLKGKFKSMLRWILLSFWFMAVPYTAFVLRDGHYLEEFSEDQIGFFIYFFMIISSIFLIKGAFALVEFSNVFGFADLKHKMSTAKKKKVDKKKRKKK